MKEVNDIGILDVESGKYFVAFMIYNTGYSHEIIKARILGQKPDSAMEKTLEFACGE